MYVGKRELLCMCPNNYNMLKTIKLITFALISFCMLKVTNWFYCLIIKYVSRVLPYEVVSGCTYSTPIVVNSEGESEVSSMFLLV